MLQFRMQVLAMIAFAVTARALPIKAVISPAGNVSLFHQGREIGTIAPGVYVEEWRHSTLGLPSTPAEAGRELRSGTIKAADGTLIDCELRPTVLPRALRLHYRLIPRADIRLNSINVAACFPAEILQGGSYTVGDDSGTFPATRGDVHLRPAQPAQHIEIALPEGPALNLRLPRAEAVLVQDDRQWMPNFTVRIGPQMIPAQTWPKNRPFDVTFVLTMATKLEVVFEELPSIAAGKDWVPLSIELDIRPGSALDFSGFGQFHGPAGQHGLVIARPDGHFAFEQAPDKPIRFYGVNLCFTAHYLTHRNAERLAERLQRLGYNAVRFHGFERDLVDRADRISTRLKSEALDQLDFLFAALKKRGIYVSIDLFTSRPVFADEIWIDGTGEVAMDDFKMLLPINGAAMLNWKTFARNLLTHVNPYTNKRYADDPALAWISLVNEGNFGNFTPRLEGRIKTEWERAWNRWLLQRYDTEEALEKAWGQSAGGNPALGTVPLDKDAPDMALFLARLEQQMFAEMRSFLRDIVVTNALLTNMNGRTNPIQNQLARQQYEYVDGHFYVDHPQFLREPGGLPSQCDNSSPIAASAPGGQRGAFTRLLDRPFTISKFNYAGPSRFRGVGGMLTGSMAALQGWSAVWRFAYSHDRENLFEPGKVGYFDVASDPLNQAAERAALCLFLRGDMLPARHTVCIAMTEQMLAETSTKPHETAPPWHALALVTRVGTFVGSRTTPIPGDVVLSLDGTAPIAGTVTGTVLDAPPYAEDTGQRIVEHMRKVGMLAASNSTDLTVKRLHSETGQLLVDAPQDLLVVNTPRTSGGYAPAGKTLDAGTVQIIIQETDASVWVSSLDGKPIAESSRLLITHLTDVQNSGAKFAETARQTLVDWGGLPHLVRNGSAAVRIRSRQAEQLQAWALSTGGRRVGTVPVTANDGMLHVPLNITGPDGACMLYEVAVEP